MKEIKTSLNKLDKLIKWLKNELNHTEFATYISEESSFTSDSTKDIQSTFFSVLQQLKEIKFSIQNSEEKAHIMQLYNDICITKKNKIIELNKEVRGDKQEDEKYFFFSNLIALINQVEENLSEIFEYNLVNYDIYSKRTSKKHTNNLFFLEKLAIPLLLIVITWYLNTQLTDIKETQQHQLKLKAIEQKYQIIEQLKQLTFEEQERIGNLKFAVDCTVGLLELANKANSQGLSAEEMNSFKILMESMKNSFSLSGKNQININNIILATSKQVEIYDLYQQRNLTKLIENVNLEAQQINHVLTSRLIPIYNKLIKDFTLSIKRGNVLDMNTTRSMSTLENNINTLYESIDAANKRFHELAIQINNVYVELGQE